MPATRSPTGRRGQAARAPVEDQVGNRLRAQRERRQLSLRELARRLGISASAVSQIETGKSRPSVSTLFAIASELDLSLDALFSETGDGLGPEALRASDAEAARMAPAQEEASRPGSPIQRARTRSAIDLGTGVHWERLSPPYTDPQITFLYVVFDVGGSTSRDNSFMRHGGTEYGLVITGTLEVTIDAESYALGPGDSFCFQSTAPHRVRNIGKEPAHAVWFGITQRPRGHL